MDKMEIKIDIIGKEDKTEVEILMSGKTSRGGLIHAIGMFLMGLKQSTDLALVTEGIEEFCERLGKDNEE